MQYSSDSINDGYSPFQMALRANGSTDPDSTVENSADLHRKAFQPGADPMVNMTCHDPAWGAWNSLLPSAPSNTGASNPDIGSTTGSVFQDGKYQSSPKDSPLSASSLGSPNSARDFDTDTPLITGQDDFNLGYEQMNQAEYAPLFNVPPQTGDAAVWNYGLSTQQTFQAEQAPFANNYTYSTAPELGLSLPRYVPSGSIAFADIDPRVLQGSSSPGLRDGQHTFAGAHGHDGLDSAVMRLSLSESVSGYSSGTDTQNSMSSSLAGLPSDPSAAPTPSVSSGEASPVACSAPSQETIHQVTGAVLRERLEGEIGQSSSMITQTGISHGIPGNANAHFPRVLVPLFSSQQGQPISDIADAHQTPCANALGPMQAHTGQQSYPPRFVAQQKSTKARKRRSAKQVALGQHSNSTSFMVDGKRWFRCGVCDKVFDRAFNLKAHQVVHSKHRVYPYECPFERCRKRFSRAADCRRHTQHVHVKKGEELEPGQPDVIIVALG